MALDPEEVGARIAQARKARGWTHQDFAERVGEALGRRVNLRTVQRWQKGRNPQTGKSWLPRLGTLMIVADVLNVPNSYFVEAERREDVAGLDDVVDLLEHLQRTQEELRRSQEENAELLAELLRSVRQDGVSDQVDESAA